jgi:hypothetical protein
MEAVKFWSFIILCYLFCALIGLAVVRVKFVGVKNVFNRAALELK